MLFKKIVCVLGFVVLVSTSSFAKGDNLDNLVEALDAIEMVANVPFEKNSDGAYIVYFDKEISDQSEHRALVSFLNAAKATDTIIFKINTDGGSALGMITIINAIKGSAAMTIAEIQTAYSAGGIIAMSCKRKVVMPYATMMIHSVQTGSQGSINNIKQYVECWKKLNDDIIRNSFKNFLTEKEINYINDGGILWMNEDEIRTRLKK